MARKRTTALLTITYSLFVFNVQVVKGRRLLIRQAVSPVKRPRHCAVERGQPSSEHDKQDHTESAEDNVLRAGGNLGTLHAGTQALAAACPQQEKERETTLIENTNNPIWPRTSEQHCTNETSRATQRYHTNEQHKREQEQQIVQQQVPTSQQVASVHLPAVDAPSETAQMETPRHTKQV